MVKIMTNHLQVAARIKINSSRFIVYSENVFLFVTGKVEIKKIGMDEAVTGDKIKYDKPAQLVKWVDGFGDLFICMNGGTR